MPVKKVYKPSLIAQLVVQQSITPLGGRYQITPTEASVQKLPVQHGVTTTASVMAQGFNPYVAEWSPYHGAAYAVIEATARLVAAGANWSSGLLFIRNTSSGWMKTSRAFWSTSPSSPWINRSSDSTWFAIYRWERLDVWYL